jgi:hypothetical protein
MRVFRHMFNHDEGLRRRDLSTIFERLAASLQELDVLSDSLAENEQRQLNIRAQIAHIRETAASIGESVAVSVRAHAAKYGRDEPTDEDIDVVLRSDARYIRTYRELGDKMNLARNIKHTIDGLHRSKRDLQDDVAIYEEGMHVLVSTRRNANLLSDNMDATTRVAGSVNRTREMIADIRSEHAYLMAQERERRDDGDVSLDVADAERLGYDADAEREQSVYQQDVVAVIRAKLQAPNAQANREVAQTQAVQRSQRAYVADRIAPPSAPAPPPAPPAPGRGGSMGPGALEALAAWNAQQTQQQALARDTVDFERREAAERERARLLAFQPLANT